MPIPRWLFVTVSFLVVCPVGCSSKSAPTKYDYGSPALVVEGTEVWQVLHWGNRGTFRKLDTDHDGELDVAEFTANIRRAEASQRALKILAILDEDGNRRLTEDEYCRRPPAATIVNLDEDNSGTLSLAEYSVVNQSHVKLGRMDAVFATFDRNGDGQLDADELATPMSEHGFYSRDSDGDNLISEQEFVPSTLSPDKAARMSRDFRRRDSDLNGTLTLRELFFVDRQAKFWILDRDGDNRVSRVEFMKGKGIERLPDPHAAFDAVDKNSDGFIGLGEFRERPDAAADVLGLQLADWPYDPVAMLKQLDADHDGGLTASELVSQGMEPSTAKHIKSILESADRDKDGRLTREEFVGVASKCACLVVDADHDGLISAAEFHATDIPWATADYAAKIFARVDADGNGQVDYEEFGRRSSTAGLLLWDWDENGRTSYEEFAYKNSSYVVDGRSRVLFQEFDRDGSGDLTAEEQQKPPVLMQFVQKDRNGDGLLSFEEYCPSGATPEKIEAERKRFGQLDRDGSNSLKVREYFCHWTHMPFWEMDRDGDDTVTLSEFRGSERFAHLALIADAMYAAIDLNRDKKITFSEFRGRSANVRFAECDVDMDGRLSVEEFGRTPFYGGEDHKAVFTRIDQNSDGAISAEEYAAIP